MIWEEKVVVWTGLIVAEMMRRGYVLDLLYLFLLKNVYLFIFQREREREREREERGRERRRRERIPSRFCTVSTEPNAGLKPTKREIMTRAEIKSQMLN